MIANILKAERIAAIDEQVDALLSQARQRRDMCRGNAKVLDGHERALWSARAGTHDMYVRELKRIRELIE